MGQKCVVIQITLNGKEMSVEFPPHLTALQVLRDVVGLTGTKEGCGIGECGACTIVVDGQAVNSCLLPGARLDGCSVLTVEGLEKDGKLHLLQEKFIENHAVQCGFCTPGLLMSTYALLAENEAPDRGEISKAIAGNLCRCTGYKQIISTIEEVVGHQAGGEGKNGG
jgi:carbon-monoxide dehydrogenase small subunit